LHGCVIHIVVEDGLQALLCVDLQVWSIQTLVAFVVLSEESRLCGQAKLNVW